MHVLQEYVAVVHPWKRPVLAYSGQYHPVSQGLSWSVLSDACMGKSCLGQSGSCFILRQEIHLQERGIRSGTLPAPLAVGFGKACEVARKEMEVDTAHIKRLADRLYDGLNAQLQHVVLNGPLDQKQRYVGNLNLSFAYVEGESLLMGLKVTRLLIRHQPSLSLARPIRWFPSYLLSALIFNESVVQLC